MESNTIDNKIIMVDNKKITFMSQPSYIGVQLRQDFPEYNSLPIKQVVTSIKDELNVHYKSDGLSYTLRNLECFAANGYDMLSIPDKGLMTVEQYSLKQNLSSRVIDSFLNGNSFLNHLSNITDITEEQLDYVKSAIIVYDPLSVQVGGPMRFDGHCKIHVPEEANLRNRLVLGIYVRNTPFEKSKGGDDMPF